MPTWDICITSIPHRHASLCRLLGWLNQQMLAPDQRTLWPVGCTAAARLYLDNLETSYGDKTQALIESSSADYVSSIDDDDMVAPDFVENVLLALAGEPDYVGFPVRWTANGAQQRRVEHSLDHGSWSDTPEMLKRDITQFNPMRRELALLGKWSGGYEAERRWSDQVRATGRVKTQAWIEQDMYYYQENGGDTFLTPRQPLAAELIQPPPAYPWLTSIGYFPTKEKT